LRECHLVTPGRTNRPGGGAADWIADPQDGDCIGAAVKRAPRLARLPPGSPRGGSTVRVVAQVAGSLIRWTRICIGAAVKRARRLARLPPGHPGAPPAVRSVARVTGSLIRRMEICIGAAVRRGGDMRE